MVLPANTVIEDLSERCNALETQKAALEDRVAELDARVRWFEEQYRLAQSPP